MTFDNPTSPRLPTPFGGDYQAEPIDPAIEKFDVLANIDAAIEDLQRMRERWRKREGASVTAQLGERADFYLHRVLNVLAIHWGD